MPSAATFNSIFFLVMAADFQVPCPPSRVITITECSVRRMRSSPQSEDLGVGNGEINTAVGNSKTSLEWGQVGFTVEQMIELLNAGVGVETLLDLISWRLEQSAPLSPIIRSSRWIA